MAKTERNKVHPSCGSPSSPTFFQLRQHQSLHAARTKEALCVKVSAMKRERVVIIGGGRVGLSLGFMLQAGGTDVRVVLVRESTAR